MQMTQIKMCNKLHTFYTYVCISNNLSKKYARLDFFFGENIFTKVKVFCKLNYVHILHYKNIMKENFSLGKKSVIIK